MEISRANDTDKKIWNDFVRRNYPPVGAFMQTWEWGEFQRALGRTLERYFVRDGKTIVAALALAEHRAPFGFTYGYASRGPVLAKEVAADGGATTLTLREIKQWAERAFPRLMFIRLEPPLSSIQKEELGDGFSFPSYYVQPRFNHTVRLMGRTEEEIAGSFHPSTRSNLGRAEKRGVTVATKAHPDEEDYRMFSGMMADTIARNSGKNAYPGHEYFASLFAALRPLQEPYDPNELSIGTLIGYRDGEPAAMNFVLYFADTATYLYGASFTKHLSAKVPTYLHWAGMQKAKALGFSYYDLGGIDQARWPSLTDFKRQFRGEEFSYIGNIDIPIRPILYRSYTAARGFKKQ